MLNRIKNAILGKQPEPQVSILLTKDCTFRSNGQSMNGTTGQTYEMTEAEAQELLHAGVCELTDARQAAEVRAENLAKLLPEPFQPDPAPDSFKSLPACFTDWWNLHEQAACLNSRAAAIEKVLLTRIVGQLPGRAELDSVAKLGTQHQLAILGGFNVGNDRFTGKQAEEENYLRGALERAQKAASDWKADNEARLFELHVQCSDCFTEAAGLLARTCNELHQTGLNIFTKRIEALGLHEAKVRNLYFDSADYVKYQQPAALPIVDDVKILWFQDSGKDQRSYCAKPPPTLACLLAQTTARNEALTKLLKQAKAELSKALAVAA